MAELNQTPDSMRTRIAFFGRRNAGKSSLINALTGQDLAIVSDVPGTTADPVSKAMEILPLGPCLVTDTAGLDDEGELGAMRVRKSLDVLATTDIAVWVASPDGGEAEERALKRFREECAARSAVALEYRRGDSVEELKRRIASAKVADREPGLLDGIVGRGDSVLCIVPIDESAPKGRLILPQQQVLRDCLDRGATATVCQPDMLPEVLVRGGFSLAVTDSQAFGAVAAAIRASRTPELRLTSFSILFARQKGDLAEYVRGLDAVKSLRDGDKVLVAEGCTHHRQCNDIGTVKIPRALRGLSGRELAFSFASGNSFALAEGERPALVVHCGGCMLTRREVQRRIGMCRAAGVPIVNYGLVLAAANGLPIGDVVA